jgi:hypothetical protein
VDVSDTTQAGGGDPDDLLFGGPEPAEVVSDSGGPGHGDGVGGDGGSVPDAAPQVAPAEKDDAGAKGKRSGGRGPSRRPRGGFSVEFRDLGDQGHRARYDRDQRCIYVNTSHPQVAAARGKGSVDEPAFRRLAYEVAFTEYSIALASELNERGEYIEPQEPIFEIRNTIDRVTRRAAGLYAADLGA